jgi:broad specificity phosphatase PhoE
VAALKEIVAGWRGPGTLVVVTHALTVGALLRTMPEQAETIVVRRKPGEDSAIEIVGRIPAPR